MSEFEMEVTHKIYSKNGYYYTVFPDPDGGDAVELRYYDDLEAKVPRAYMTLPIEMIEMLINALKVQRGQVIAMNAKDKV